LLRQYPPLLFIDAHEMGSEQFFFPPNSDPVYHEVPDRVLAWINYLYGSALAAEFNRQRIPYFNGEGYDLYVAEYGDTVPVIGFHAAGMTFEKHDGDPIARRLNEHYVAMWTALSAAASERLRLLGTGGCRRRRPATRASAACSIPTSSSSMPRRCTSRCPTCACDTTSSLTTRAAGASWRNSCGGCSAWTCRSGG
jgi:hypothetical protein